MSVVHQLAQVDLNLLVVLDELLRARSTTLAARRLGRTQSAVSHALRRLRHAFADPLFVRVGRALRPTAAAEQLASPLREVLDGARALLTKTRAFAPASLSREFVIAGTDYAEIMLMPRLMPALRRDAPGVTVVTRFLADDVERAIQAGEVDLAYGTRFRPLAGLLQQKIGYEPMRVLLRRGHPALRRGLTTGAFTSLDHVLVTPREQPGGAVDAALGLMGLRRRVVLRLPHFAAAAFIVAQTDLVVTLPAAVARTMAGKLGLVSVAAPFPLPGFTFSIAYGVTTRDDPAHAWFRARVLAAARAG